MRRSLLCCKMLLIPKNRSFCDTVRTVTFDRGRTVINLRAFRGMRFLLVGLCVAVVVGGADVARADTREPGTQDTAFSARLPPVYAGRAVVMQPDGKMLVGGQKTLSQDAAFSWTIIGFLVRINADNTADTAFNTNAAAVALDGDVRSVVVQSDGKILVGGSFTGELKRFNADGTADTAFNTNAAAVALDGSVCSVVVQSDGKILVGGVFTGKLKRFNADGTADTVFNTYAAAVGLRVAHYERGSAVNSVVVQSGGKILAGGDFVDFLMRFYGDPTNLSVVRDGAGSGAVVSGDQSSINCGASCLAEFYDGESVTLSAEPAVGSMFTGWSGDCAGTSTCVVPMTQARSVTATFTLQPAAPTGVSGATAPGKPTGVRWLRQRGTRSPLIATFTAVADVVYTISANLQSTKLLGARATPTTLGSCAIKTNTKAKKRVATCRIRLKKPGAWLVSITPMRADMKGIPATKRILVPRLRG